MIGKVAILASLSCHGLIALGQHVEEFHAHGPMDFHNQAMSKFLEMRKIDPKENLSYDGNFLKLANEHAIRRMSRKPDEAFILNRGLLSAETPKLEGETVLQLPSPDENKDAYLTAAVNSQGTSGQLVAQEAKASALAFNEEVGLGAISKTGALPMGAEGEWLSIAEEKMKKEASLDYQALLWEMGTALSEDQQIERGGLNLTMEEELLRGMEEWFIAGGGKLQFTKPNVTLEEGFKLIATEDINENDAVVTVPMKLIMCKQTARNVVIGQRGKYLGEELQKTFDKDEEWGMVMFLLHEYYKETAGNGSKWGPFIRTLRMRYLSTKVLHSIRGTIAAHENNEWRKASDKFMWWSVGSDGPCSPTTGICRTKPLERGGDSRFNIHQIRWAYWVVKQNSIKIKQMATGLQFIALIPYFNFLDKSFGSGGGVTFDLDGTISIRAGREGLEEGMPVGLHPGNYSDSEFFMRYLKVPDIENEFTEIKLKLPGVIPKGSKFHYCLKGSRKEQNRDDCKATYRSESMFWKSQVLTEWRKLMNLPPRLQELRMWATRLHLYGGKEEMALLSTANKAIAGLPLPVDQMPAEEQLMLLGLARDNSEAAMIATGPAGDTPPPQLYSAPDPEEDYEARRGIENLATLALQAQNVYSSGNTGLNATQVVLNQTRDFFQHGVLPMAGLDELDMFLLKKIGMLAHCGFENDMKIIDGNVTEELMCAMRVHLMNETEIHVFCPKDARVFEDNCQNVEFMNFTAISEHNEISVIQALRNSLHGLLASYPSTVDEDVELLDKYKEGKQDFGPISLAGIQLRFREKSILHGALGFLDDHETAVKNGSVLFQIELKAQERIEADLREEAHKKFVEEVKARALLRPALATLSVDLGEKIGKVNLTLEEGRDLKITVLKFAQEFKVKEKDLPILEKSLRDRVVSPPPLQLMLGVITPVGMREILAIPENENATVETGVFCAKHDNDAKDVTDTDWCRGLLDRVEKRLNVSLIFQRRILLVVPIDAPDSRKLKLIIRQGEQHDLIQFVSDFFQLYHMPTESIMMMANEVHKRLPAPVVTVPVGLPGGQRQVIARFCTNDNITEVTEAFANFYDLDNGAKIAIMKRARYGMAPGTFMI